MKLRDALNKFYRDMSIGELQLMNSLDQYPNVTYNSLLYLDIISYRKDCTASYLSRVLHISKPAVTVKINELLRQGLITKEQSKEDKRVYYLSVDPKIRKEFNVYNKNLFYATDQIEKEYSQEQVMLFCEMLDKMSASFAEGAKHE
ncbi:MarR family transcriptional regulator [Christensenellaceae bacterium OttesenSCG-928-K19]|nr:MarR family transcriptional regulator [Christensenellaceae bacterium OttesenSCG-928-K19]